ncbi:MAG: MFS transporter [Streptosporangiales bacterium]|nr:MFS transporter [Streptosporangiales bacterium]
MAEKVDIRTMLTAVYLPCLVYAIGQGAVIPVIALTARDLGASVAVAGFVAALVGVGQIVGDIPAGALASRVGERNAMIVATAVAALGLTGCLLAPSVWLLAIGIFGIGLATSVWQLARLSFVAEVVPYQYRGRALSTLGGVQRVGMFLGPFVGAGAMHVLGGKGAYWVYLAAALAAGGLLLLVTDVTKHQVPTEPVPTLSVLKQHWPILRTLGFTALLFGAVRSSRQVVIPLWADSIGLSPTTTSLVYGISGAVDMLLFYPAGKVMDRYGRMWVAVPSMVLLGVAHLLLPLTHQASTLLLVGIVMGIGNGIGSGLVMTMGADAAPATGRATFLGAWRLAPDVGMATGPLTVSAVSAAIALGPAVLTMGGIALAAVVALHRWVPRTTGEAPAPAEPG